MFIRSNIPGLAVVCLSLHAGTPALAADCSDLTANDRIALSSFVSSKYDLAPDLTVEEGGIVGGSCFRLLTFRSQAPRRSIQLFLSPDRRFLSETLMDISVDPKIELRRVATRTNAALLADNPPSKGDLSAPVVIVEFSDFECPFCSRFNSFMSQLSTSESSSVRLVFRHLPLSMHPWARRAAMAAACVSLQNQQAFWMFHDRLFVHQKEMDSANFDDKAAAFLADAPQVDLKQFKDCLASQGGESLLEKDEAMARLYHVNATPTLFVNGVRKQGFVWVEDLRAAIRNVLAEQSRVAAGEAKE
jgi:protein-disulfide isomerase